MYICTVLKYYSNTMILSKQVAVYINLTACKFKKYTAAKLKKTKLALTPEQFLSIDLLWNQGSMSQQKLADLMQKDKNSITKLVDALEGKGYVKRSSDPKDRRTKLLVLTSKAESIKDSAKETGISMLDDIIEGISEEELTSLLATLHKICHNMDRK